MYQIISDSSCDLPEQAIKKHGLVQVPFYITVDGKTHQKEKEELKVQDFYQFMNEFPKVYPKTSMPSIQDYLDVFEVALKEGKDIICICITATFSGSFNSAMGAKQVAEEKYPNNKITVIDTSTVSVLQGLLVLEVVKMQQAGLSYEEVINSIEELKQTGRIFFTIASMDYLINGGRVGKLSGMAAGKLGIKPLIEFKSGEIHRAGITRNRNAGKKKLMGMFLEYLKEEGLHPNECKIAVGYGFDRAEGNTFRKQLLDSIKESYPDYQEEIEMYVIGGTIAVHTGPYPIGVGVIKKKCYK